MESHRAAENACSGIACSKCGAEMIYPRPLRVIATYPPMRDLDCPKCGHHDHEIG
jgi:DNA-directed RNA polymerase subunit RPC12/RpoP